MRVVCDIETNDLHDPDIIWVICAKDIDTGEIYEFVQPQDNPKDFERFSMDVSLWIGHNFLSFDLPIIRRLLPRVHLNPLTVFDTLIAARVVKYNHKGGHSLEAWGNRFGRKKPDIEEWNKFTPEMIPRCHEDVAINEKLYKLLESVSDRFGDAFDLEFKTQLFCNEMSKMGFAFDKKRALELKTEIDTRLSTLDKEILEHFPPKAIPVKEITPKATKSGVISKVGFKGETDLSAYSVGATFTRFTYEPFNPASVKQIVERLNEAGWKPFEKTKTHIQAERDKDKEKLARMRVTGWKVNEANLATLPKTAPEGARKLAERIVLASRSSILTEWLSALRETPNQYPRIHGRFNGVGCWSHRMSHQAPNMGNIPSNPDPFVDPDNPTPVELVKHAYNLSLRELWVASPNRLLVGTDADGIQLRVLAHYMNDPEFTKALIHGRKEDGTDAHSMNALKLGIGLKHRDMAKTFIYAWLLGAGVGKVAEILKCSIPEAKIAIDSFIRGYPGLENLKEERLKKDEKQGYFESLDGRCVPYPEGQPHKILAGYLQCGEAIIMKRARILWGTQLKKEKVPFWSINFVHDEWQTETRNIMEEAEYVGMVQRKGLEQAGKDLCLNVPITGSSDIGRNWRETH